MHTFHYVWRIATTRSCPASFPVIVRAIECPKDDRWRVACLRTFSKLFQRYKKTCGPVNKYMQSSLLKQTIGASEYTSIVLLSVTLIIYKYASPYISTRCLIDGVISSRSFCCDYFLTERSIVWINTLAYLLLQIGQTQIYKRKRKDTELLSNILFECLSKWRTGLW